MWDSGFHLPGKPVEKSFSDVMQLSCAINLWGPVILRKEKTKGGPLLFGKWLATARKR